MTLRYTCTWSDVFQSGNVEKRTCCLCFSPSTTSTPTGIKLIKNHQLWRGDIHGPSPRMRARLRRAAFGFWYTLVVMRMWFKALVSVVYSRLNCKLLSLRFRNLRSTKTYTKKSFVLNRGTILLYPFLVKDRVFLNEGFMSQAARTISEHDTAAQISAIFPYMRLGLFGPGRSHKGEVISW